jgi:hypothetical protein
VIYKGEETNSEATPRPQKSHYAKKWELLLKSPLLNARYSSEFKYLV